MNRDSYGITVGYLAEVVVLDCVSRTAAASN